MVVHKQYLEATHQYFHCVLVFVNVWADIFLDVFSNFLIVVHRFL